MDVHDKSAARSSCSDGFLKEVAALAVPVALQSMLQSSFSIVDQIMIGQLGSVSIAGVGLAGKFSSIFSMVVSAVGAVAGIMISQYIGQKNDREVKRSFYVNLSLAVVVAALFMVVCVLFPDKVMDLYTKDISTRDVSSGYLSIVSLTFLPMAGATMLSTYLRCTDKPRLPLYASIVAAVLNTILNYILIFGAFGISPMGYRGAAIATVVSQIANFAIMLFLMPHGNALARRAVDAGTSDCKFNVGQYLAMLLPVLVCEFMWSLGENVYAAIYGNMGTDASAAMTLTNPIQGIVIGALCGLSQAAGVLVGKRLGSGSYDEAYSASKRLMLYGAVGSVALSVLVVMTSPLYVKIYNVDSSVRLLTRQILFAYALVAPFKVLNMILGGGILRSGGKTKYVMGIDLFGTWVLGVPLGLLSAFVLDLSIPYVYFILSLEEAVRFAVSLVVFRRRRWMQKL